MKNVLILAGDQRQFSYYCSDHRNEKDVRFIFGYSILMMQGLKIDEIVVCGTFWEREDAGELYRYANLKLKL